MTNTNITSSTEQIDQSESDQEKDRDKRVNRPKSDQDRDRRLYEYLLVLSDYDGDRKSYNEIADRWGMSSNRVFVQRILQSIFPGINQKNIPSIPGITLNRLVNILSSIDKYRKNQCKHQTDLKFPKILTRSEKLRALHLYAKTLPNEKQALDLDEHENQLLLQQIIEDISDPHKGLNHEKISEICKYISGCTNSVGSEDMLQANNIDRAIEDSIENTAFEYFQYLQKDSLDLLKKKIIRKVKNAIKDIKYQNGSYQFTEFLDRDIKKISENISSRKSNEEIVNLEYKKRDLETRFNSRDFIQKLTKSIIENRVLTEEFPVHLKYIEIQEIQQSIPQGKDSSSKNSNRLFAYTVKVYFYVRDLLTGDKEEFYEEVTGVGSPLSHAIAAMNRALLWDIKSLKTYVPIAKQITFNTEIIGASTNGSVWAHYVVGLCKRENIDLQKNSCPVEELANGDYCGFDTLEVYAKASFYARLRAIKKTGVSPINYIGELKEKIKQVKSLREGEKLLNEYPFSLEAMRSYLTQELLNKEHHRLINKNDVFGSEELVQREEWSLTEYEAHLSIAESYFKEGLYSIGKNYLDCIQKQIEESNINPISKIIIARYHLCYFRYHYLTDLEDYNYEKNLNRSASVAKAEEHLDRAYDHLKEYVYKCSTIDELPYVNFYGFFTVMSKLSAHRAKLYFFMSYHRPTQSISKPIDLFQEARMYAARSGNPSLYSMWSAYQSWCHLVAAYTIEDAKKSEAEIDKAETILIHALQSYEKTGKKHYESIKLKSGKENSNIKDQSEVIIGYEGYGKIKLQGIPVITELTANQQNLPVEYSPIHGSLSLDMSLLTSNLPNTQTLLFGTQSSMLLFAIAMLKLCHYRKNESEKHDDFSIISEIEIAKKMFAYSSSFAEEGLSKIDEDDLDRWSEISEPIPDFHKKALESQCLAGLYPHRITQFTDFGKIYFIACELILLTKVNCEAEEQRWGYIEDLIKRIKDNYLKVRKDQTCQKRYNGHLQEHFQSVDKYIHDFKRANIKTEQTLEVRKEIVMSISNILRTGQLQVISDSLRKLGISATIIPN
jgi:hypothetical protein